MKKPPPEKVTACFVYLTLMVKPYSLLIDQGS